MATVLVHVWQDKGLGQAPFRIVGFFSFPAPALAEANTSAYNAACQAASDTARHFGVAGGICDVCGTALMNNYVIQSADKKRFVVGCDCVAHTDDARLISQIEAHERKRKREAAKIKRDAKVTARLAEHDARLASHQAHATPVTGCQWCDHALATTERERTEAAQRTAMTATNQWLIDALAGQIGSFVSDMVVQLRMYPLSTFSDRQRQVLANIYARAYGRRNSVAYNTAIDAFNAKVE